MIDTIPANIQTLILSHLRYIDYHSFFNLQESQLKQCLKCQSSVVQTPLKTSYLLHGVLHREDDLPAIEWADGRKEWYQYGMLHREGDMPAIEDANGKRSWYRNGRIWREE